MLFNPKTELLHVTGLQNLREMKYTKFNLLLISSLLSSIFPSTLGLQQKILPDLRRYKVEGMVARFIVNRDALERELQNSKQQDAVCGTGEQLLSFHGFELTCARDYLFSMRAG